jgi:hypothetical protein
MKLITKAQCIVMADDAVLNASVPQKKGKP